MDSILWKEDGIEPAAPGILLPVLKVTTMPCGVFSRSLPMNETPTRREFAALLALLGAAGMAPAGEPGAKLDIKDYAAAVEKVLRFRFGKLLSDDDIKKVQRDVVQGWLVGQALRRAKVASGEEPAFIFSADI
jgi:hypothetical protein